MTELEKSIIELTNKISDKKLQNIYYSLKDIEKTVQDLIKQEQNDKQRNNKKKFNVNK